MTSQDQEDYRRAEEKFFDEGNPNTEDPPWLVDSHQTMRGTQADHCSDETIRRHSSRYILRWLQISANLAQIAAALAAILGLYFTLIR